MPGTIPPRDGGLAADLADLAARDGIDLGKVEARPNHRQQIEAFGYVAPDEANLNSGRGEILISRHPYDGGYSVTFGGPGMTWARGRTLDLVEAARAAEAWRADATLRELAARYPFMSYTELAQAYEDGTEVEYRWRSLLNNPELAPYWPLLRALLADPVLGALAVSTSHRNFVRLELGPDRSYGEVHVIQLRDDFQVEASWDMTPRRTATVAQAVALAAALVASHPATTAPE